MNQKIQQLIYKISMPKYYVHPVFIPLLYLLNFKRKYKVIKIDDISTNRKSDLLFILGTGSAVNNVSSQEWGIIRKHDSLGFNYFILHDFIPTYFHVEYPRILQNANKFAEYIQSRENHLKNVIRLHSSRAIRYGLFPRTFPELFLDGQTICYYQFPRFVYCPAERPFQKEDFNGKYMYRGSLNLMLFLGMKMGYKKLVLLGCEMNKNVYFWENMPEANWLLKMTSDPRVKALIPWECREKREKQYYEGVYASKNKHDHATAIKAFNDFVFKPNKIELYVARKESVLYPEVPFFDIKVDG